MRTHPADVGIETRHKKRCGRPTGGACTCKPGYRGTVYDRHVRKNRHGPWVSSKAAARGWRVDAQAKLQRGPLHGSSPLSVLEAGETWFAGAHAGTIRNRTGDQYKPSVLRSYESSFRLHVAPVLGGLKLAKMQRRDVQALIDRLTATLDAHTVRNAISPLRSICRHAVSRELITNNPCSALDIPKGTGRRFASIPGAGERETIATREEAAELIAALPNLQDRAVWATAFYAGLRRGAAWTLPKRHRLGRTHHHRAPFMGCSRRSDRPEERDERPDDPDDGGPRVPPPGLRRAPRRTRVCVPRIRKMGA